MRIDEVSGVRMINKVALKKSLLTSLDHEINEALKAARQAQETAAHKDNQPENQYDTLSLEAAYLAHGQSERILKLQQERLLLEKWLAPEFDSEAVIGTGALVTLMNEENMQRLIWITPCSSRLLDQQIQAVSSETPLAKRLAGLGIDDEVVLPLRQREELWCVESIQ